MINVVNRYASGNKYSIVVDDSNPNMPILYTATGVDITKEVIDL